MAHHDEEAVTNISYQLLTTGHKFDEILEEAVEAVNDLRNKGNSDVISRVLGRRGFRYAALMLAGSFVVFSIGTADIAPRMQPSSEKELVLNNKIQMRSEVPNWTQYKIGDITHAIGEGIRFSGVLAINADEQLSDASKNNAPDPEPPLPKTTGQMIPPIHPPLDVLTSRSAPNVVQVQNSNSETVATENSAADLKLYISRGDRLFAAGDVAGARVFYQRAAEYGSAIAAKRLGGTYDPKILAQAGLTGLLGNEETARRWYRFAQDLLDNKR